MRNFLVILISLFTAAAQANDFAVALGYRTNTADVNPSTISGGGKGGFQGGVLGFFDISGAVGIRAGALYTQRSYTSKSGANPEDEFNYAFFDIPVGVNFKFADYAGVFGGIVLPLNISKSCKAGAGTCDAGSPKSPIGIQFGVTFKFAPQMGAEIFYEMMNGDVVTFTGGGSFKDAKSAGANFLYTFE